MRLLFFGGLFLFFFVEGGARFQIFRFEDLEAFFTFYVVNAGASGDDFSAEMVTHNGLIVSILVNRDGLSSDAYLSVCSAG